MSFEIGEMVIYNNNARIVEKVDNISVHFRDRNGYYSFAPKGLLIKLDSENHFHYSKTIENVLSELTCEEFRRFEEQIGLTP